MADLIIKPSSGNSLVLQDEGGDDAISISTTGVSTIANATITAGTFPAGHVIQTSYRAYNDNNSDAMTSSTLSRVEHGSNNYEWYGQINNVASGNHVLVQMSFTYNMAEGGAEDIGGNFGVMRNGATEIFAGSAGHQGFYMYWAGINKNNDHYGTYPIAFIDQSPAVGTNTYYLSYACHGATHVKVSSKASDGYQPYVCILQEIQT